MIISIPEITICAPEIIAGVPSIIVCIVGKIESLTALIALGMEILVSHLSAISDDVELTATQTELIAAIPTMIPLKGKTGGKEGAETGVSDLKQPACWVWLVRFPFMPPYRAYKTCLRAIMNSPGMAHIGTILK